MPVSLYVAEGRHWDRCAASFDYDYYTRTYGPTGWTERVTQICGPNRIAHQQENLLFVAGATLVASYLLQLIYYKLVLYVVFGRNLSRLR